MGINQEVHSDLAVPPGEYLEEVLEELGMAKEELARRMKRPAPKLSAIYKGKKAITANTAIQLEKVVGVPAHIWTGLEAEYRLVLARKQIEKEERSLLGETKLTQNFCYAKLAELGFVKATRKPVERVIELQKFFGVTSLNNIEDVKRYQPAFRLGNLGQKQPSPEALATWLRIGEIKARRIECSPFDKTRLQKVLPRIRSFTRQRPEQFEPALRELLASAGVTFVLCSHLPKTYANGATFWLGPNKAVVMTTIRCGWADIFWFSLFHELGHILLHGQHKVFIEFGDDGSERQEQEANRFAEDTLIPRTDYDSFVGNGAFYEDDVLRFAKRARIHPGIVVGRLQNDGRLKRNWQNNLRGRFQWKGEES